MSFTNNEWSKCDIINKIIILIKRVVDTIYATILTKYEKYPSTTILKYANVLAKVNKLPYGCLLNTTRHDAKTITMHICTMNLTDISHKQRRENEIIQLWQTFMWNLIIDLNNTPKTNNPRLKMLKVREQSYGQNRLLIIYGDKWYEPSYVASLLFCSCIGTIPLYGKHVYVGHYVGRF